MGNLQGWGGRIANGVLGGWGFAGVTNWWPNGTPVLGPRVNGAVTAPNTAVRWSVNGNNYKSANVAYSRAIVVKGAFTAPSPSSVFNKDASVRTPDFRSANIPLAFSNVRTP